MFRQRRITRETTDPDPRPQTLMSIDDLLQTTSELLSAAAADPDRVLKWVLIYFGVSSLGFMAVWLIGYIRDMRRS